jgi:hypothetical protein
LFSGIENFANYRNETSRLLLFNKPARCDLPVQSRLRASDAGGLYRASGLYTAGYWIELNLRKGDNCNFQRTTPAVGLFSMYLWSHLVVDAEPVGTTDEGYRFVVSIALTNKAEGI